MMVEAEGQSRTIYEPATGLNYAGIFWGSDKKPPLLCFHGWQDNAASLIPLAKKLSAHFSIWSIDFSGHGRSDHIGIGGSYNFLDWGLSILHVADALGIEKITTISHSMGAALMGFMGSMFPERFVKLCLVEALFPWGHDLNYVSEKARKIYQRRAKVWHPKVIKNEEEAALIRQAAGEMALENATLIARRNLKPHPKIQDALTWSFDQRIKMPQGSWTHEQVAYHIEQLTVQSLVIRGEQGAAFVGEQIELARAKGKNNIHSVVLKGGHHVHMDNAEETAREVLAFLR